MKRLVVAPHADDESYGCGGLIAKYPDTQVFVVAAPDEERAPELAKAMDALGVCVSYDTGSFTDGRVGEDPIRLVGALDELLNAYCPRQLYLPFPGTHQDHIAVYEAGMRASRLSATRGHWYPPEVLVYDVPAYDLQLGPTDLRWNVFEKLSFVQVHRKAEAIACYESQLRDGHHPGQKESVLALARSTGAARGVGFAEQFALVRMVRT